MPRIKILLMLKAAGKLEPSLNLSINRRRRKRRCPRKFPRKLSLPKPNLVNHRRSRWFSWETHPSVKHAWFTTTSTTRTRSSTSRPCWMCTGAPKTSKEVRLRSRSMIRVVMTIWVSTARLSTRMLMSLWFASPSTTKSPTATSKSGRMRSMLLFRMYLSFLCSRRRIWEIIWLTSSPCQMTN